MIPIKLSTQEIALIKRGLPCLAEWSPHILVPFQVRRLRNSRVVWINERWFFSRGLDLSDESLRQRLMTWLCDEFGYAAPLQDDPSDAYTEATTVYHADRYGSMNPKVVHGGSGRVAVVGCFQVKGVGITPLVGEGANWVHSHGCASLEEAIREVIFSEVVASEFPHGAIPTLAILDTGLCFSHPSPELEEERLMRRAIVIRPAVVRPAHIERAPLFKRSLTGFINSQLDDVQRCRDVVRSWVMHEYGNEVVMPELPELLARIAEQIAFGQVHRIFNGGYFSSNLSLDGALLDFGATRALPNWANAKTLQHALGFGDEMILTESLVQSLTFYFNKYRPLACGSYSAATLMNQIRTKYEKTFGRECLRLWGLDNETDPTLAASVKEAMRRYFSLQQRHRVNYRTGRLNSQDWLYDAIAPQQATVGEHERAVIDDVESAFLAYFSKGPVCEAWLRHGRLTARRLLRPRNEIDRGLLQKRIFHEISPVGLGSRPDDSVIRNLISIAVGKSRRHWPELNSHLTILGHVSKGGSSALACQNMFDQTRVLWLEGERYGDNLRLFDHRLSFDDLRDFEVQVKTNSWNAMIPAHGFDLKVRLILKTHRRDIELPNLQIIYH